VAAGGAFVCPVVCPVASTATPATQTAAPVQITLASPLNSSLRRVSSIRPGEDGCDDRQTRLLPLMIAGLVAL